MRIKESLVLKEKRVNQLLDKINVVLSSKWGAYALKITDKKGNVLDILAEGLSKYQAYTIFDYIEKVLKYEKA